MYSFDSICQHDTKTVNLLLSHLVGFVRTETMNTDDENDVQPTETNQHIDEVATPVTNPPRVSCISINFCLKRIFYQEMTKQPIGLTGVTVLFSSATLVI